ncbi:MAG: PEP-CTERM sorting domain-containing protein [Pseudomonadota bacterium]
MHVRLLIVLFALCSAPLSHAVLIDRGIVTFDPTTGYEWLDLTATFGRSYNDVASDPALTAQGFRHATEAEVAVLFASANVTPGTATIATATNFIELFGQTANFLPNSTIFSFAGGIHDRDPLDTVRISYSSVFLQEPNTPAAGSAIGIPSEDPFNTKDFTPSFSGNYLVRSVPEPSALALLLMGLFSIGLMRRRRT